MGKFKAVIFDLDGVVIDTNWIWDKAFEQLFVKYKKAFNVNKVRNQVVGLKGLDTVKKLIDIYKFPLSPEKFHDERMKLMNDMYYTEAKFVDSFLDFFNLLKARGYKLAIATNAYKSSIDKFDAQLKVRDLFEGHLYSVDELNLDTKPSPAIYNYAARELKVDPSKCLVIEDSPNGIDAGKSADMFVVAITTSYSKKYLLEKSKPDAVVNSFSELSVYI